MSDSFHHNEQAQHWHQFINQPPPFSWPRMDHDLNTTTCKSALSLRLSLPSWTAPLESRVSAHRPPGHNDVFQALPRWDLGIQTGRAGASGKTFLHPQFQPNLVVRKLCQELLLFLERIIWKSSWHWHRKVTIQEWWNKRTMGRPCLVQGLP